MEAEVPLCAVCNHRHVQGVKCEICGHVGKTVRWHGQPRQRPW
jgi:hypothetical protein